MNIEGSKTIPEVFVKLFSEIPADKIIWQLAGGKTYTAGQMVEECRNETELARHYMSDALRVTRDLITRTANKK